ncbi:Oidioi.mRNA.OKI2018_I69.PAR.g11917.t1.cds [Oikopleura dioica]|uniref:Oidioi.mRNA.OKI2018_I69.PAR.g11917.t1.cds n=1 Tax=Oikopleura dioica TaxID=34765 RepID=A0ABN7S5B9_OIKDI|nr:Oidioi.mRNA.OKI2018_I69.PAR.g11917.t1.cds [Oikopleura dioica]
MKNQPLKSVNPPSQYFTCGLAGPLLFFTNFFLILDTTFFKRECPCVPAKNTSFAFKFTSRLSHSLSSPLTWLWITASPLTVTAACDGNPDRNALIGTSPWQECISMCETGIHYCSHAGCNCVHDINGLTFSCNSGYELSGTYDCEDIDECQTGDHDCGNDPGMTCYNNVGSFDCMCDGGYDYTANPTPTCTDQNECTLGTHQCCEIGCDCNNISGGYTCSCQAGFETDNTLYGCKDVDECATGVHDCGTDPGMNCVNNVGSFDCICDEEYSNAYSFQTGKTCVNVDECTLNTHNCCTHAGCSGYPGFTCACDVGYRGDGTSCVDIDECDEDTVANLCGADSLLSCINNIGSYDCSCLDGYDMVFDSGLGEETCVQVDECVDDNLHDCVTGFTGICTDKDPNVDGIKFECGCIEGFYGSGFANGQGCIQELDECTMGTHNCAADADCFDTQAAFICTCHPGFTDDNLDGTSCTNINECTDGTHNCAPDVDGGVCTDNPGSFECSCDNSIAYGDGLAAGTGCTLKVDECADNTHTCDANAACTDTQEAYTCTCNAGYDGPGFICYQVDECAEKGLDILGTAGVLVGTETNYADFVAQLDTMSGMVNGVVGSFHGALEDQFNIESTFTIGNTGGAEKVLFSLTGATNQFIPDLPVDTRDYFMSFEVVQDACSDPAQDASSTCTLTVAYETFLGGSEKSATIPYTLNNTCTDYTVADGCPMSVMILINRQGIAINGTVTYSMVVDLITPDGNVASTAFVDNNDHRMTEFRFVREGDSAALISSFYINQAGSETNNCDDDGGICTDTIGSFTCDCDLSTHFDNNSDEPGTDCVGLVDECTVGGHDCHPTGGVCTDLDDGWSCTCATTHFDLNPDDPGKQCDQLLPCDARLIGDVFDDSALSPRGFWDCNRGSKKTTCNYICPVSEAVGVTASCKHKSGLWRDPTRPLTCNLPPTCDLAALETEITDFLGRIGSTYVFNENDWQIDGLQEDNFLRGRWNCGNSFFTKKIQFSCNRKDGGTRAVWKFKGDPSDHPDVCQGIFRSEGLEVRSKYVKKA